MKSMMIAMFSWMCWTHSLCADALSGCGIPAPIDRFLNCFASEQESKKLILVTKSADGECGIETLGLLFDYYPPWEMGQARILVVNVVQALLREVNSHTELRHFFVQFPLTENQVVVRIRKRFDSCFVYPVIGNIAYITAMDGRIFYSTINSNTFEIENLRIENFGEGIKKASQ